MARAEALGDHQPPLYERDLCLGLEQQAALLRERRFDELDLTNLIEEIEAMARKHKKAVKSNLVVLLAHLLKDQLQPEQRSSGWRGSIVERRRRLRYDFEESPSLRLHAAEVFARAYADAREQASAETALPLRAFPKSSPSTLEQALDPKFLSDSRKDGA
ncbi:MAG TPA: DUF29 domain-containing protein [Geminicoccaceae bacterium]|nr:DUF29 domain-containing protein [Geminicoccaceae bacterium]